MARSSRPAYRLKLNRDGAFYVAVGWFSAVCLTDRNEQVAPFADLHSASPNLPFALRPDATPNRPLDCSAVHVPWCAPKRTCLRTNFAAASVALLYRFPRAGVGAFPNSSSMKSMKRLTRVPEDACWDRSSRSLHRRQPRPKSRPEPRPDIVRAISEARAD
jgi:hypothetical protein